MASGVAPQGVDAVTVLVAGQEEVVEVEPVTGAFVVAALDLADLVIVNR